MKERTIQELHDKDIGHKKFAMICDIIVAQGHNLTNIKEYNEKFKFQIDNYDFEYSKYWKASAKSYVEYILDLLNKNKRLANTNKW